LFVHGIARSGAPHLQRASSPARLWPLLFGVWAALMLGVVLAAPAQAGLPEWGTCRATPTRTGGRFEDAGCVTRAGRRAGVPRGAYEWSGVAAGMQVRLTTATMEGSLKIETAAGRMIECTRLGSESFARARGPNATATPLWEFGGCSSEGSGCQTGASAISLGEINNLFAWQEEPAEPGRPAPRWGGRLGYVSKETDPRTVGILYTVANHERLFTPVSCDGPIGTVWIGGGPKSRNSFLSTIGPVDTMTSGFTERFAQGGPGVEAAVGLEHHAPAGLLAFLENHWEPVTITAAFHFTCIETASGELEIKADP
jgi:hypothetical protein